MQPAVPTLRQRHIQALQRRAGQHQGAVRQLIDARLQALEAAEAAVAGVAAVPQAPAPRRASLLAGLLAHIQAQGDGAAASAAPVGHAGAKGRPHARPPGLKALRDHAQAWSGLRVQQRVRQALAAVPPQAGPLNTQRLLHETLCRLQAASPAYLQRLVAQVETLLWLEQQAQGTALPKPARPEKASVPGPRPSPRRPSSAPPAAER
jgi:hypothetical protein